MKLINQVKRFINIFTRNRKSYPILNIVRVSKACPGYDLDDCYYELHTITITRNSINKCIIFKSKFVSDVAANITIIEMSEIDNELVECCQFYYTDIDTKFMYDY